MQPGNTSIRRSLMTALLLWLTSSAASANLLATVDRDTLTEYEVLTLTVTFSGDDPGGQPNFAPLQRDWEILGTSSQSSSSIRIAGGRTVRNVTTDWIVQLRAQRRGQLTIPPLQLGAHQSNPIPVVVGARSAAAERRAAEILFFETSVDARQVYVQSQIVYTVRLFWSESITGEFPQPPSVDNAVVETLVDENRFVTVRNNKRYNVLEKQYAIFPQRSGRIDLPKEVFNGARGRDSLFSFSRKQQAVYAESKPLTVEVMPRPAEFPAGAPWLPAARLDVQARWSDGADSTDWRVGQPLSRTLTLTADGVTASALPTVLNDELRGARTYPDPPATDESVFDGGIRATRTETQGIVPTAPGVIRIPDRRIPWWNTTTDQLEYAIVPGLTATVLSPEITHRTPSPETIAPEVPEVATVDQPGVAAANHGFWPWLALVFGLLWVASTIQWFLTRQQLRREGSDSAGHAVPPDSAERAWTRLVAACRDDDAGASHEALRAWCHARWGFWSPSELGRRHGGSVADAVRELDAAIYRADATGAWRGGALLAVLEPIARNGAERAGTPAGLARLNPA